MRQQAHFRELVFHGLEWAVSVYVCVIIYRQIVSFECKCGYEGSDVTSEN